MTASNTINNASQSASNAASNMADRAHQAIDRAAEKAAPALDRVRTNVHNTVRQRSPIPRPRGVDWAAQKCEGVRPKGRRARRRRVRVACASGRWSR